VAQFDRPFGVVISKPLYRPFNSIIKISPSFTLYIKTKPEPPQNPPSTENISSKPLRPYTLQPFLALLQRSTLLIRVDLSTDVFDANGHTTASADIHPGALFEQFDDFLSFVVDPVPGGLIGFKSVGCGFLMREPTYWTYLHPADSLDARENA